MTPADQPLTLREKIAYGFGDAASNFFWKTFTMFLMFFYTDVYGLTAGTAGTMFLVTRIWDSLFDPLMGIIADRTNSRWGKFRPYLLWMAIPYGIFGVLTFTTPDFGPGGKLIYAYVTYTMMMLVYSAINVPYGALMGVMSSNSQERTSISSYRFMFAFGGSFLVQLTMQRLVDFFGKGNEAHGFQMAAMVWAVAAVVLFLLCFAWTRERVQPPKSQRTPLKTDMADLIHNVPWLVLLGLTLVIQISACLRDGSILYYFKYYLGNTAGAATFMVTGSLASVTGIFLVQFVTKFFGKKRTLFTLTLCQALLMASTYFIQPHQMVLVYVTQVLIHLCGGPLYVLISAMQADTVDYSEWKTGRRATGLVFSASSMANKFGWAIGGAMTGWVLSIFGFTANVAQTVDTQHGIRLMMSVLPASAAIASALVLTVYRLDDKTMETIEAELTERRKKDSGAAASA